MILKPVEQAEPDDLRAEVCVIGSGPSGQAVATTLAESGIDVLVVEAGGADADRWGRRMTSAAMPSVGRQYPNPGYQASVRIGGTSDRWALALDPSSPRRTGIRLCRLDAVDLEPRPTPGAEGWPIALDELEPHYRAAEEMFGLSPVRDLDGESALVDRRLNIEAVWVADGSTFREPQLADTRMRMVSRCAIRTLSVDKTGRITDAVGVTRSGAEVQVSADVFVITMGAVQTTRLLLDSPWAGGGCLANSSGLLGRYLTDHPQLVLGQLVLDRSADLSALESLVPSVGPGSTVRWPNLVTSAARSLDPDIARLAATLVPTTRIPRTQRLRNLLHKPMGSRTGGPSAAAAIIDAVRERRFDPALLRRLPSLIGGVDEMVGELLQGRGRTPRWSLEEFHWAHLLADDRLPGFQIFAVAEQLPNFDNRIVLSEERNNIGARRPLINWRWSGEDAQRAEKSAQDVRELLEGLDVGHLLARRGRASVHKANSHHPSGTVRMSIASEAGVVDRNLRTHDHPNLYVVGSAVFNASGCITPTLTAVALGVRLGRHLAGQRPHQPRKGGLSTDGD